MLSGSFLRVTFSRVSIKNLWNFQYEPYNSTHVAAKGSGQLGPLTYFLCTKDRYDHYGH